MLKKNMGKITKIIQVNILFGLLENQCIILMTKILKCMILNLVTIAQKDLIKEGFDKIGYSNDEDGNMVIQRLKDIDTTTLHKSVLQLKTEEFY